MSKVTIVRYQTTVEAADENQRLVEQVYSELAANDPAGLRYATFRLDDGVTFVHVSLVDGDDNPLFASAAFQAFQAGLSGRLVQGPEARAASSSARTGFDELGGSRCRLDLVMGTDDSVRWPSTPHRPAARGPLPQRGAAQSWLPP